MSPVERERESGSSAAPDQSVAPLLEKNAFRLVASEELRSLAAAVTSWASPGAIGSDLSARAAQPPRARLSPS